MEATPSSAFDEPPYGGSDSQATTPTSERGQDSITEKHDIEIIHATFERQQSHSTNRTRTTRSEGSVWKTTFFRIAPLTGIICMISAIASILAALGILVGSRGAAVSTWNVRPTVMVERFAISRPEAGPPKLLLT